MSFFSHIKNFFTKYFGSATWERTASATIGVIAPLLETAITLAAGSAAGAIVTNVIQQVQNDLAGVSALIASAQAGQGTSTTKQQIQNVIIAINANLATLLADADVKNSAKIADITSIVKLVSGELSAILSELP
jgi:hypothetical protein